MKEVFVSWGLKNCRLLVVDSLPQTAIEHCVINWWTKKKDLEVIVAAVAEKGWVAASFEAVLAVTVLGAEGALETSEILFLELVGGGKDALAFLLPPFLLVTRVKTTSSASGASTSISTSGEGVEIGLGP